MATKSDVIKYVMHTPDNTNPAILSTMLDDISGSTADYSDLKNKPKINGVELSGNKTTEDLGISADVDSKVDEKITDEVLPKIDTAKSEAITEAEGYADTKVGEEASARESAIEEVKGDIDSAKTEAISTAEGYTDTKAEAVKTEAINTAA